MIYVTSDLHGRFDCLKMLLKRVNFSDSDWLYIIGDVIDRNDNGGVDILTWLLFQPNVQLILGNHEAMLLKNRWIFNEISNENLDCVDGDDWRNLCTWKANGGGVTIEALSKHTSPETRQDILEYLDECPLFETVAVNGSNYVLVHGGLGGFSKTKRFDEYSPREMFWERVAMTTEYSPEEYTVIVGHTPTVLISESYRNRMIKSRGGWWNIDTGAAMNGGYPMLLCLDTLKEYYIENGDQVIEIGGI